MTGRFTFHFLSPDIIQTASLFEVSKGKVEIRDPLSSSSMEGWAPALLPVSDASIDKARGKMANVHPGACILKLLLPAAFRWALNEELCLGKPLSIWFDLFLDVHKVLAWFTKSFDGTVLWWATLQINMTSFHFWNPYFNLLQPHQWDIQARTTLLRLTCTTQQIKPLNVTDLKSNPVTHEPLGKHPKHTLWPCFMVSSNLKIADSLSTKEHLELCLPQTASVASKTIS